MILNAWTAQSFNLYNQPGYLDLLYKIYPMLDNNIRTLSPELKSLLKTYYDNRDDKNLFNLLIKQNKFPIKDSYKAFFSRTPSAERPLIIKYKL